MNDSLEAIIKVRNNVFEQTKMLDQVVVKMGGASVLGTSPRTTRRTNKTSVSRAPSSAGAEGKRRTRTNPTVIDYYVMEALTKSTEEFTTGNQIIEASKKFGFEINGVQMRSSIKRLIASGKAEDNGEQRAKKRYRSTVTTNDIKLPENFSQRSAAAKKASSETTTEATTETTETSTPEASTETVVSAVNTNPADEGSANAENPNEEEITAKNAVSMVLSADDEPLSMKDLVEATLTMFSGRFTENVIKTAVNELAKLGEIAKSKVKGKSVYSASS